MDTSVLLELLNTPMESGNHEEEKARLKSYSDAGDEIHLPVAALVEVGTHILKISNGDARRKCAQRLDFILRSAVARTKPWRFHSFTWDEALTDRMLKGQYPNYSMIESLAQKYIEMGDMMIAAEFTALRRNLSPEIVDVDVWTRDQKLQLVINHLKDEL